MNLRLRTKTALQPHRWYRATVNFDGVNALLKINGVSVPTVPATAFAPFSPAPHLCFGGNDVVFGGLRMQTQAGLLADYKFDETSGATASDTSGNGHNAALSGMWEWESRTPTRLNWIHSGHTMTLSWPAESGLVLESTGTLGEPSTWTEVAGVPAQLVGNQKTVTVDTSIGTKFFRLAGPA